jgi:hypothetical protein
MVGVVAAQRRAGPEAHVHARCRRGQATSEAGGRRMASTMTVATPVAIQDVAGG